MIKGIHHTGISTPDIDRLMEFYCGLLGFEFVTELNWTPAPEVDQVMDAKDVAGRAVMLRAGNAYLELLQFSSPPPKAREGKRSLIDHGISHFCINVENLDFEVERLSAKGVKFNAPPMETGMPFRLTYARDPDENSIEFMEILDPDYQTHLSKAGILIS